jgi:hypothetical protein
MTTATDALCAIEKRAHRAIVQELRLLIKEVQALQPGLAGDDSAHAHAHALLLKLEHLRQSQVVDSVCDQPPIRWAAQG